MASGRWMECICAGLVLVGVPKAVRAQTPALTVRAGDIVREIDDPHNGDRWLLVDDASHPGGPGLLYRVGVGMRDVPREQAGEHAGAQANGQAPAPVIRAGDRLVIEENTATVEAHLEAVAMGPALAGSSFSARLSIGGHVVRAVATAPGRARLQDLPSNLGLLSTLGLPHSQAQPSLAIQTGGSR